MINNSKIDIIVELIGGSDGLALELAKKSLKKGKFFVTANLKTRALRRYRELKLIYKRANFHEVLKSIKKRDKSDYSRKVAPLKKTKDSVMINTTKLSKSSCFLKIKKIIDYKIRINGNL